MNFSKYYYIILNDVDIDIQFKVYKKILEINGKISDDANPIDKNEPYWFYNIESNYFGKCEEKAINKESDLICNTVADFFKKVNLTKPVIKIEIGDYIGKIYRNHIEVGFLKISKDKIKEILKIMNE